MKPQTLPALPELLDPVRSGWTRTARWFDVRAPRERLLLSAAAAALLLMLLNQLWIEPAWQAWSAARQQQRQTETALQQLRLDAVQIQERQQLHSQQVLAELASLRARVHQGDLQADARQQGLISATEMLPLLEQLLRQHSGLRVRSSRSAGASWAQPCRPLRQCRLRRHLVLPVQVARPARPARRSIATASS
jgi:type II secretory pathway component PulM